MSNSKQYALRCTVVGLAIAVCLVGCRMDQHTVATNIASNSGGLKSPLVEVENSEPDDATAEKESDTNSVQQVAYVESSDNRQVPPEMEPVPASDRYPVDLAIVLQLAGADNWNVRIARERMCEAAANLDAARAAILPSLNLGVFYNKHDGQIQQTEGDVITRSRNSLFVGGGAGIDQFPLNGGAGGPARLFVDFSIADALFKPLAARQRLSAASSNRCRVLNDTLLEATLAYYELVRAQSGLAVAIENHDEAAYAQKLTNDFVESGKGSEADVHRINVIVNDRKQQLVRARTAIETASARLAEILQLDPCEVDPQNGLIAIEQQPLPIEIIDWSQELNCQIDMAQRSRCEIAQAKADAHALNTDYQAEFWRAVLPNLFLGYSAGVFGGGQGSDLPGLDWRDDFDIGLAWQVRNLGFGNAIAKDVACSRYRQQLFATRQIRDKISQQVASTYHTTLQFQNEIELTSGSVEQAEMAYSKNIEAIRGLEGLPLEAIQSLEAVADSRLAYLNAVVSYNQWQLRLLRATGQPFAEPDSCGSCQCCNSGSKCTSPGCNNCCSSTTNPDISR